MDLRLNRAEIVDAISAWAKTRLVGDLTVDGVTLDGNGQGATVKTKYELHAVDEIEGVDTTTLATKSTPTKTETAKAKARKAAEDKKGDK